jgi:site-specific recombinase XerD
LSTWPRPLIRSESYESCLIQFRNPKTSPLQNSPTRPRQVLDYRRAVRKLLAHLPTATVEVVDKRAAGDYRTALTRLGVHPRTAAKDISALASLWKHLESRGLAPINPWRGLGGYSKSPSTGRGSARKRPLTDTEVARLLTSNHASPMLRDAVTILALSGMRTEELARMKVADLRDLTGPLPYVALRGTKTAQPTEMSLSTLKPSRSSSRG